MKIGEFAQKHAVTQDTIRHYLDMGLLATVKKGGQYKFDEADSNDLKKIMELKQLDFSLNEIQKILTFQRLSGTNTDKFRSLYLSFLEEKKNEVTGELLKYSKMRDFLEDKISEISIKEADNRKILGFPMNSLGILACPLCKQPLNISDGTIEENMIINASIICECGYKAIVENGIYIDETAVRTKLINGKKMPTKEEYMAKSSHTYINFLYKGMTSLIGYINKYGNEPKYIMELNNCVGFFLMQYIKDLPRNATYILIDYDKDRIGQLKRDLEMYHEHKGFIFLCCDLHRLPLVEASIDIAVDYLMTEAYRQLTGEYLPDRVLPLLKQDGLFAASFFYTDPSSKYNKASISSGKDYSGKAKLLGKLADSCLKEIDTLDIGPAYEDNEYDADIKGMELYQAVYAGKKRTVYSIKSKAEDKGLYRKIKTSG